MSKRLLTGILGSVSVTVVAGFVAFDVARTGPVRRAVTAYTQLLGAANRQDLEGLRRLCSTHYLKAHSLAPAAEGGVVGLPRNIHPNFQARRHDRDVWICPTNRVGPVYQFVHEGGRWRFDGPVGLLRGRGEFLPLADGLGIDEAAIKPGG